ncbi:hypothetical protein PRIC1_007315 [Phytophthora ramorum]|uniref:uncharacterized protein n=1 Tax=Phytophthora ramorum TaxID=164328 RepID=UPI0030AA27FD|nr:hypothetical protein KRP23_2519 [Phytophthora ramorum]
MKTPISTPPGSPRQRPLLTDSPLTYRDRRQVRYMERQKLQHMKVNAAELADLASDKFDLTTLELDEIYEHVCYPREGNLDGLCREELEIAVGKQTLMLSGTDMTKV